MADWLVEQGIGEERAIRLEQGEIAQAQILWPGSIVAGQVEDAVLISRASGSARGTVRFSSGEEALVSRLPREASEGASLRVEVTRAAIEESGRRKLAQARPTARDLLPSPSLADRLEADGHAVRITRRFPAGLWEDLASEAFARKVNFDGGTLHLSPTPAMTLIDIDGDLPPGRLALAAVPAIAATLQRLDLGGSIGVDFPTLQDKADRRAVDEALGQALQDWPHERTGMNGFGFVQIVSQLRRMPILHLYTAQRAGAAARLLLRQAEGVEQPGALLLRCHPAVQARLTDEWLAELSRRSGRQLRIEADASLALEAGFAQAIAL